MAKKKSASSKSKAVKALKQKAEVSVKNAEINYGFVFLAAFIYAVIAQVIHTIGAIGSMQYYLMPKYFVMWSSIMMPNAGPPGFIFYLYSFIFSFITGVLLCLAYLIVRKAFTGTNTNKGLTFGLILILVSAVPGTLAMYLLLALPPMLLMYWLFETIIIFMLGSIVIANLLRSE